MACGIQVPTPKQDVPLYSFVYIKVLSFVSSVLIVDPYFPTFESLTLPQQFKLNSYHHLDFSQ